MSYRFEWALGPVLLGAVLLPVLIPPFALLGVLVAAFAALAALVALAGAVLATPYLLVRSARRHLAERRRSPEGSGAVASVIAQAGMATQQPGVAALTNPATARSSQ
jgi:hypothetical protein